ncbi:hypothetical protein [Flavobacterium sp. XS2P39]|uniref:hypothetical protein n=1 Tax=Flavobacterium sp. XS2P39 TaxID=3401725 RepID=UPI003AAB6C84
MKIKTYAAITFLALFIVSCSVVDSLLTFNIATQTSFTIESGFPLNVASEVLTPDVTTNSSAVFENNNTKAELVKDVKLKELKLTITDPNDKTFTFLKSIHLYISTDANDEIELAYLEDINSTSNTLNLTCTTQNLDKYIKAPNYKIRAKAVIKETLSQDITVKSDMKFSVTADPF